MAKQTEIVATVKDIIYPRGDGPGPIPEAGDRYVVANVAPYKAAALETATTLKDLADAADANAAASDSLASLGITATLTVTGVDHDGVVRKGSTLRFHGSYADHPRYGRQFQFVAAVRYMVTTRAGVTRYLTSVCHQVGQVRAARLWDAYGPDAVTVLRTDPARVVADGYLPADIAGLAAETLADLSRNEAARIELYELFQGRGFPRSAIADAIRLWGIRAAEMVRRNPFNLMTAGVSGCGFIRCDKLYLDLGKNPQSLKRQALAAWHAIREQGTGDTWHAVDDVVRGIMTRVGSTEKQVKKALACGLRTAAWARVEDGQRVEDRTSLFVRRVDGGVEWIALGEEAEQEKGVAESVCRLLKRTGAGTRRLTPSVEEEYD